MTYFTKPIQKTYICDTNVSFSSKNYILTSRLHLVTWHSVFCEKLLLFILHHDFQTFEILLESNLLIAHYPLLSSDCLCILFPPPFACLQALHWRGLPFPCLKYSGSQEEIFLSSPWSDSSGDSSTTELHQGGKRLGTEPCISQIQSDIAKDPRTM